MPLRWSWFVVPFGIGVGMLGSSGCIQIGPDANDGGSTSDSSDAETNDTVEQQCALIVNAFCARTQECYGQDPQACIDPGIDQCCGRNCSKHATSTDRALSTCISDLKAADCETIDTITDSSGLPASCQNVVTY